MGPKVFQKQNDKISRGEISGPGTHYLHLDTLGIINGCVDDVVQSEAYSFMAWNNTYGVKAINETTKHKQLYELYRPNGILDQARECQRLDRVLRKAEEARDGDENISPHYVEEYCFNASTIGSDILVSPFMASGQYGWFDVTHPLADPFPTNYHIGWLNQHWVQKALGAPLNFTWASSVIGSSFNSHGDMSRGGGLEALADLLDHGVKVHLVYGDRDYACNVRPLPSSHHHLHGDCIPPSWKKGVTYKANLYNRSTLVDRRRGRLPRHPAQVPKRVRRRRLHGADRVRARGAALCPLWAHAPARQPELHARLPGGPHGAELPARGEPAHL